jgi:hypothetical protein
VEHQLPRPPRSHPPQRTQYHPPESAFNFNDLETAVELLLQTDLAQQKTLLFGYSDARVKEWTTLKKYMEGNHLKLLNLSKFIEQSLQFDL